MKVHQKVTRDGRRGCLACCYITSQHKTRVAGTSSTMSKQYALRVRGTGSSDDLLAAHFLPVHHISCLCRLLSSFSSSLPSSSQLPTASHKLFSPSLFVPHSSTPHCLRAGYWDGAPPRRKCHRLIQVSTRCTLGAAGGFASHRSTFRCRHASAPHGPTPQI